MLPSFISNPNPEIYLSNNYIVIDLETTNKNKGGAEDVDNKFVYGYYSSPTLGSGNIYSEKELKELEERLLKADFIVTQGGKFELKWFKRSGIKIERLLIYDTLLGDYVIAGNRKFSLDLDSISRRYGGSGKASLVSKLIAAGVCPSDIPSSMLRDYCKQDVRETERVFLAQRQELKDAGLLPVFFLRCITTPVLAEIELNGLFLDKKVVLDVYKELNAEYSKVIGELNVIAAGVNMASPQQVASFLYTELGFEEVKDRRGNALRGKANKKFSEGQPLTDEKTVLKLKPKNDRQKKFLLLKGEEGKIRKKITGYCERYLYACGYDFEFLSGEEREFSSKKGSCVIHGKLNQSISQTHRLTSSDPNLQNVDRKLKKVVCARKKGWKIRNADYKTLEFTTAGILTKDPQIRSDIENNYDIHRYTSEVLTNSGQSTDRQSAKPHTFKPLYGGRSGTAAEKEYYQAFREKYHVCHATQNAWVEEVLKTKKLRTVTGLIFYWPNCEVKDHGYITHSQQIFDYPVQMFATADLAPTAVCLLWHSMKELKLESFLINEVHDSCVIEEKPEESEKLGNLITQVLSKDVIGFLEQVIKFKIDFPIRVDQESFDHWGSNLIGEK